jgi:hypothetical protein
VCVREWEWEWALSWWSGVSLLHVCNCAVPNRMVHSRLLAVPQRPAQFGTLTLPPTLRRHPSLWIVNLTDRGLKTWKRGQLSSVVSITNS